ncbi:hypothetical protein TWF102_006617 [Orbilia oligospora]|uniref:Calcineurin-like phosphoesterase domain-containing protein n=1 Tax=Orbilia oligospora TaxID=2813651 RepID=A0A7C8TRL2_ORBOL|nr:hypothetical protein TWF103_001198 [Orbilia oligospora]KAF3096773.1 hypothetical protein TWF102_006617 [Orbilia oligospora]KAF3116453.1 hypothetical protein TWF706_004087 [Orbilia oligospora]KAF3148197.1 hypothetical protein TWF594_001390 [Orbilia oligospora]KAF3177967.1 hypothetical protein TWF751_001915 [Orbilia oligospora]
MSFSSIFSEKRHSKESSSSISSGHSILPKSLVDYIHSVTNHSPGYPTVPFQVVSDLHLELTDTVHGNRGYFEYNIAQNCPYLILAGDIGTLNQPDNYLAFLRRHCEVFEKVFLVLGNHEFYGTSRREGLANLKSFFQDPVIAEKLVVLNRNRYDIPGTKLTVLGCTLQSEIRPEQRSLIESKLNDFRVIKDWKVDDHNAEHSIDIAWLRDQIEEIADTEPDRRIFVATHHAPSFKKTSAPQHEDSPLNSAFCTGILEGGAYRGWKGKDMIKAWVFGHTHWCCDLMISGVRVVSNQRGYWYENTVRADYKEDLVLEV